MLGRVEDNDGPQSSERNPSEFSGIEADGPVAEAALMSTELVEVHVSRANQLAAAVFEKQTRRPPVRSSHLEFQRTGIRTNWLTDA
jgi:hypothetical protein